VRTTIATAVEADAIDAGDQVEARRQSLPRRKPGSGIIADCRDELPQFAAAQRLHAGDLRIPVGPDAPVAAALTAVLQAGNVLAQLVEHPQRIGQGGEPRIRRGVDRLGRRRARRDQAGVDSVVLGALQNKPGIGPHLGRLEHDHDKTIPAQLGHHRRFVTATRRDPDPLDPVLAQPPRQGAVPGTAIVDLQPLEPPLERRVELAFAGIDAGADHGRLAPLPRPFLEGEPWVPSTIRVR